MAVDPLSPVAPARLRALLLPVGKIKRSRFLTLVKRLQAQNVVRLGDVSPDGRPNKNSFSPLAFPTGMVVYDLSISVPPISHLDLYPFEIFREPLVIIAIADGAELPGPAEGTGTGTSSHATSNGTKANKYPRAEGLEELQGSLNVLKQSHPRSLVQQLLIFDYAAVENLLTGPETVVWIPRPEAARSTTVKTVMCDITSRLLGELSGLAERMQEWPTVESPKASSWGPRRTPEVRPVALEKLQQHRMTMPAQMPGANGSFISAADTNFQPAEHDSPTTFDEITRSIQLSNRVTSSIKASSKSGSKEHSRERLSVGFVGANERSKSRVKGRLNIIMGTLFLQAGRWPDSLKELAEGAAIARANSDYIWHAKALESILQCLLMFGWAGMDFKIPQICYPTTDKASKSASQTPSMSQTELYSIGQSNPENRLVSLQNLANLIPDLSNNILHLYTRAANITDEPVPQLVFSETVIRLARLLATIYIRDGSLDDDALGNIVMNCPLKFIRSPDRSRGAVSLRKTDISSFLFRALPPSIGSDVPVTDSSPILVGMASVLSSLGLDRKKAFVLKQLFSILIPGLVQARKIGAAEVGIHPAAGLSALNHSAFEMNALDIGPKNMDESVRILLALVGRTYGVPGTMICVDKQRDVSGRHPTANSETVLEYDSVDSIIDRAFRYSIINAFGDHTLKVDILKACINFCEALPDFPGVLQFTVDLLQTIKGTLMLIPDSYQGLPTLPPEEQVRLFNNVKRTVAAAKKLGDSNLEAEYWDDFLVRGVDVVNLSDFKEPVRRSRADFGFANIEERREEKNPFIYSAFSKTTTSRSEGILVAEEPTMFKVTLQNPFEFDVEIENLRIDGTGVSFEAATHGLWLAPFTIQESFISGLATTDGTLEITGCIAKIKFCRERRFPIFKNLWKPELEPKIKRTGLAAKEPFSERPLSWSSNTSGTVSGVSRKGPEPDIVLAKVIKKQPMAIIKSTSLSQSAIMLLEGETRSFDITLQNISTCPLDFISFSFEDSTTRQLQSALTNKENISPDIYELELQLSTNPALTWRRDHLSQSELLIAPGETATFTIDVYGKPGLDDAVVKIDYAHVYASSADLPETFYCRQISLPLTVTVNSSVDVTRCDVLPFSGDFAWTNKLRRNEDSRAPGDDKDSIKSVEPPSTPRPITQFRETQFSETLSRLGLGSFGSDHCILLLDLRNAWPSPLSVSLFVTENISVNAKIDPSSRLDPIGVHEIHDELQPGHASRFVLVVPRVYVENLQRPIPSLNVSNKRQFVVSANKLSYEAESSAREIFWIREELLKRLRGSWKEEATGREGVIDLRAIRLNARMVDALRIDDVDVTFSLRPYTWGSSNGSGDSNDETSGIDNDSVSQTGHSKFTVKTNTFLTLSVTIINRSSTPIHLLLRLQPSLRHTSHAIALDLSKRLAWSGMLQRSLPILEPHQTTKVTLGITVLCRGEYEIGASIEEIRRFKACALGTIAGPGVGELKHGAVATATPAQNLIVSLLPMPQSGDEYGIRGCRV
ncbi:hypothetical protein ACJ72_04678 [Emergomyces africanus]|uniref:Hypercellular protein HypA n=1 Tax=Emergomyces africanus TaxID=1955775 RepID=A0A1B7NW53_9EURO|nr:hypothetical protein ACJ72_04678 [Emergomyces africanus]